MEKEIKELHIFINILLNETVPSPYICKMRKEL
jgi:hypothetical protein